MSGNILVVDTVATNRIVLKVKLSAAFYHVVQAASAAEAVALSAAAAPDLVLASADLPGADFAFFVRRLREATGIASLPVVAMQARRDTEAGLALLRAGAAAILAKPFSEPVLLARLRSLLRQAHGQADLGMRAETAAALGLAEAPAPFVRPGRIAVIDLSRAKAKLTCAALAALCEHRIDSYGQETGSRLIDTLNQPDVVLLRIAQNGADSGLGLLAELRTAPATRHASLVGLLDSADAPLAATVLDMGAHDVVDTGTDPREIVLRLSAQLRSKLAGDLWRAQVSSGLQAAVTDPLTGLYNRRYALSHLERMLADRAQDGRAFAVMVADLDHFKQVNDTYGHAAGDNVLARVASQLSAAVGADGMVARLGGEEFLIVLPDGSRPAAERTAARLCRLIRENPVGVPGQPEPVHVTISIGVTLARPGTESGRQTVDGLINQADRALYGAKEGGRDTVTFAARSAA